MSSHNDGFYGLDGGCNFHPRFCAFLVGFGFWRSNVRYVQDFLFWYDANSLRETNKHSGIPWGVFQTLSTTYACEVVPTVLRPYVTAYGMLSEPPQLSFLRGRGMLDTGFVEVPSILF